jgi:hypothetical protein
MELHATLPREHLQAKHSSNSEGEISGINPKSFAILGVSLWQFSIRKS